MMGLDIHVIWDQSKVTGKRPMPLASPNNWLTGMLFGTIQHIQEKTDSPVNRYPEPEYQSCASCEHSNVQNTYLARRTRRKILL